MTINGYRTSPNRPGTRVPGQKKTVSDGTINTTKNEPENGFLRFRKCVCPHLHRFPICAMCPHLRHPRLRHLLNILQAQDVAPGLLARSPWLNFARAFNLQSANREGAMGAKGQSSLQTRPTSSQFEEWSNH